MHLIPSFSILPMGDDTPILLYIILGIVALALIIGCIVLGKLTRKNK